MIFLGSRKLCVVFLFWGPPTSAHGVTVCISLLALSSGETNSTFMTRGILQLATGHLTSQGSWEIGGLYPLFTFQRDASQVLERSVHGSSS